MRPLFAFSIIGALMAAVPAEARNFMQTYGATVPAGPCGEGCTWNWNQDYFVPRHCNSCRYGLFSACKTSCTKSPACRVCHQMYPGYCSPYGCCHYCRRNCLYSHRCGCEPVQTNTYCGPFRHGCGPCLGCCRMNCCGPTWYPPLLQFTQPLANIEPPVFEVLGAIPVEGDELLASLNMSAPAVELPGVIIPPAAPAPVEKIPPFGYDPETLPPIPPSP